MSGAWCFLSYPISDEISAYGNGPRAKIERLRCIPHGDSCNSSQLSLPTHFGTHLDYPSHFSIEGKVGDQYDANFFVFNHVTYLDIPVSPDGKVILTVEDFENILLDSKSDLLLINTGYWKLRDQDCYWNNNPGLHPDLAQFFKEKMPGLRMMGFDSMSMNPWSNRELGRVAHREFLLENDIVIIEDMNFSAMPRDGKIQQVIVSPLRFHQADGASATIFALVES